MPRQMAQVSWSSSFWRAALLATASDGFSAMFKLTIQMFVSSDAVKVNSYFLSLQNRDIELASIVIYGYSQLALVLTEQWFEGKTASKFTGAIIIL